MRGLDVQRCYGDAAIGGIYYCILVKAITGCKQYKFPSYSSSGWLDEVQHCCLFLSLSDENQYVLICNDMHTTQYLNTDA